MPDLLFEIGTEELPASYIRPALDQMAQALKAALEEAGIPPARIGTFATPRRLVLYATGLAAGQPDREVEIVGPPARVAFDADGQPTRAALGFARSQGLDVADLRTRDTRRGAYCCATKREPGRPTADILCEALPRIAAGVSFPKSMVWADRTRAFARPVRSTVALLDGRVLDFQVFGVRTGRRTFGHPFLAPQPLDLLDADPGRYRALLADRHVLVDPTERRDLIRSQLEAAVRTCGGDPPQLDGPLQRALLDEVAYLVEMPTVVVGRFDEQFLAVPAEVLEAAMVEHQRYFPVRDAQGALRPRFLVVTNRTAAQADTVREGNEHVLRARLADARFFWQDDLKTPLAARVPELKQVGFLQKLGTYADKAERLVTLVNTLVPEMDLSEAEQRFARRAALLCKADLITATVVEFPRLQGVVGGLLAAANGEPAEVARAIREHYRPRHAEDALPASPAGRAVSLAEKADNVAGCFSLGLVPSGSQDPYALRRQCHAVIRIIESSGRALSLSRLLRAAASQMPSGAAPQKTRPDHERGDVVANMLEFVRDRLYQICLDRQYPHDLIKAALAPGFDDVVDFMKRLEVLGNLAERPEWPDLVTVVERTHNIGKKAEIDSWAVENGVNEDLLAEPEELDLWRAHRTHRDAIAALIENRDYEHAALLYARVFGKPVHVFFDKVFVNVPDESLRTNRLLLLRAINELFATRIADLSEIVTGVT